MFLLGVRVKDSAAPLRGGSIVNLPPDQATANLSGSILHSPPKSCTTWGVQESAPELYL